ncbi:hypothetical protein [Marinicella meishanensis]|uniref:hypothetical protein n=1 Tax=Marinicella meishanensis TaxID=2873263 RepID=UPI001CBC2B6E|nr:hypothetical protein [Marinicella sp. NBU2979]
MDTNSIESTTMQCPHCQHNGIKFIDGLANSVFGRMQCQRCYRLFAQDKILAVVNLIIEVAMIFAVGFQTWIMASIWPVVPLVALIVLNRVWLLPRLAIEVPKRKKFRPSRS